MNKLKKKKNFVLKVIHWGKTIKNNQAARYTW